MSSECGKCSVEFVGAEMIVKCVECKLSFHPSCTREGSTPGFKKSKNKNLKCDSCKEDTESVRSLDEVGEDKKSILNAIKSLKNDINSNIDKKFGVLNESISSLKDQFSSLDSKLTAVESNCAELKERCDRLEHDKSELSDAVHDLRLQLLDMDQHSRAANLEIQGLPLTQGENIYVCLEKISEVIGVPFKREDFSIAHRLRVFSKKHQHPPVIVQFVSRGCKDMWVAAARSKKGLRTSDISPSLQPSQIYINEHLTAHNKAVLGRARRLARERKIHFAGYFNGKVLVKPTEDSASTRVRVLEDLDKYDRSK